MNIFQGIDRLFSKPRRWLAYYDFDELVLSTAIRNAPSKLQRWEANKHKLK
jgi:hypothetical protein